VRSVVRNWRRSASACLGVLLVVGIIAGENIAVDSTARGIWDSIAATLESHFSGTGPLNATNAVRENLTGVKGFREIAASAYLPVNAIPVAAENRTTGFTYISLSVVRQDYEAALALRKFQGPLRIGGDNVTISGTIAEDFGLSVGDPFPLNLSYYDYTGAGGERYATYPLRVASILTRSESAFVGSFGGSYYGGFGFGELYLGVDLALEVMADLNITASQYSPYGNPFESANYIGWLDDKVLVDPYDVDASKANIRRATRNIDLIVNQHGVYLGGYGGPGPIPGPYPGFGGSVLENALDMYAGMSTALRFLFLMLSLPVIVLGIYLGIVGVDLGMAERRREIGVLKARGASDGQIFRLLLIEALLLAVFAAIGGLLLGALLSQVLLALGAFPVFGATATPTFAVSTATILVASLFALLFMLAAAYRPFKRASTLTITEGLSYYTPGETTIQYRPTLDVILVVLGTLTFVVDVLLSGWSEFSILRFLLAGIFALLTPLAPFFLAFGLTRLLTRATPKVYEKASRTAKPLTGNLWPLVHRSLTRNPRRASNITVIMALALVFGLMITLLYSSQVARIERVVRADNGSDLRIDVNAPLGNDTAVVAATPGVAAVTQVWWTRSGFPIVVFDAADYLETVPRDDYFILEGGWGSLTAAQTPGKVLANKGLLDAYGAALGDLFPVPSTWLGGTTSDKVTLTIAGVVRALPGLHEYSLAYDFVGSSTPLLFLDRATLVNETAALNAAQTRLLVKAQPGTDPSTLGDTLQEKNPQGWLVHVAAEELASAMGSGGQASFLRLMTLQIAFMILIVTAGLGLILYTASLERRTEFAGMVARGADRRQVASLLLGEAWVILVLGLVIGTVLGLLTGWVFILTFMRSVPSPIEATLVFSWESLAVILATAGSMLITATAIAWRSGRPHVVSILRQRGG